MLELIPQVVSTLCKVEVKLSRNRPWRPIGKVVSLTHRPRFTPQKHYYFYVSGTHFCYRLIKPLGLVRPEGLAKFKTITLSDIEPATFRFVA
jgi:hypothetical protein